MPASGWPSPIIALILVLLTTLVAVITMRRIRDGLFHPLTLVSGITTYYILVPTAFLLLTGNFRINHPSGGYVTLLAGIVVLAATYIAIVAGYRLAEQRADRFVDRLTKRLSRYMDADVDIYRTLVWVGLLSVAAGVICYCYYTLVNGSFVRLVTVKPRTAFQTVPNTGRFKLLATAGIYAGTIATLTGLRPAIERQTLSGRQQAGVAVLVAFALFVAVTFRSRMNIAIMGGFMLIYFHTADRVSRRAIASVTAVFVVLGLSFSFVERIISTGEITLKLLLHPFISTIRLEIIMETVRAVPQLHPYQWGATLWYTIPGGVPWAPPRMGNQLEHIVFGTARDTYTAPALFVAEAWLNGGLLGTLFAAGVYGSVLAAVYRATQYTQSALARGIYPLVFLTVLSALPTSFEWAIRSAGFRLLGPVVLAVGAAYFLSQVILPRLDVPALQQRP